MCTVMHMEYLSAVLCDHKRPFDVITSNSVTIDTDRSALRRYNSTQ